MNDIPISEKCDRLLILLKIRFTNNAICEMVFFIQTGCSALHTTSYDANRGNYLFRSTIIMQCDTDLHKGVAIKTEFGLTHDKK